MLLCLHNNCLNKYSSCFVCYFIIEVAKKPTLLGSPTDGRHWITAIVMWDHTDRGPCFNHLTFSHNITWYPVVGGVPQRGEGQSGVTGPGATVYIITNLMNDTDYHVELFGFTPSEPVVYSEVTTVDFTTTGVCILYI